MFGNEAGVEIASDKFGVSQQSGLERNIAADAANHKAVQRFAHFGNGVVAVFAVHDKLGNHRVVIHRNLATVLHAGVHAHAVPVGHVGLVHGLCGWCKAHQTASRRQEIAERVLGIDTALNRPAIALNFGLCEWQFFASRDANHQLHQVQTGDAFGHWVFHLQAGVHL